MTDQSHMTNKKFRRITLDMVLSSTTLTRSSKETADAYLSRVTHLHLQRKKIRFIEHLEQCTNLKVLYLYENQIDEIKNLSFSSILSYVYLQSNNITEIPSLNLPNLKKLYLDENEIKVVSGLQDCSMLEELHIAKQRLPSFTPLEFQFESLSKLSKTLQVLDISGNGITILTQFQILLNLKKFLCQDNNVINLGEVENVILHLPRLEEANFYNNPCCKQAKYRDIAIGASPDPFHTLDEIPVPKHQQIAIRGLMTHRRNLGAVSKFLTSQVDNTNSISGGGGGGGGGGENNNEDNNKQYGGGGGNNKYENNKFTDEMVVIGTNE